MGNRRKDEVWVEQFGIIKSWAFSRGYATICYPDAEDHVDLDLKTIHIGSRQHAENRFYTLLHECGHILVASTSDKFESEHPMYAFSPDVKSRTSKAYQVSLIAEEIDAWKRGRRLAQRHGLEIDNKKFDRVMTNCIISYVDNAATRG
jgi:hypothetical protein